MSTDTIDETRTDDPLYRYGELTTGKGECIIYDRENSRAWIQSTVAASVGQLD